MRVLMKSRPRSCYENQPLRLRWATIRRSAVRLGCAPGRTVPFGTSASYRFALIQGWAKSPCHALNGGLGASAILPTRGEHRLTRLSPPYIVSHERPQHTAAARTRMTTPWCLRLLACLAAATVLAPAGAQPLDKVSFGTNWAAEAEHGGFYQALVDGTYRKYRLDVTIVPGGPNVNNRILLPVGKLDFFMSANTLLGFDAVEQNIPTLAVAAMFQKDPQVLMAHPDQGIATFEDLKKLTLFISKEGIAGYFQWLKADFGFSEARVKPYTSNPQPFLADKRSAMQGYVTSEPFAIEREAGFKPKIFLIADQGFNSYSTLIETRRELVEKRPDLVQRFVDASAIGWA